MPSGKSSENKFDYTKLESELSGNLVLGSGIFKRFLTINRWFAKDKYRRIMKITEDMCLPF